MVVPTNKGLLIKATCMGVSDAKANRPHQFQDLPRSQFGLLDVLLDVAASEDVVDLVDGPEAGGHLGARSDHQAV